MERLRAGLQLAGRYSLEKPLRSGGNADLWRALDEQTGVSVALKFSRTGSTATLTTEFKNLQRLSHPAIVGAHRLATHDGVPFIVMDLIDGPELSQYMGADHRQWLPIFRPVVDAVAYAHSRGVVHGDLKPENMLVAADGSVRLIDFSGGPGRTVADDIRALGAVLCELATGLPELGQSARVPPALAELIVGLRDGSEELQGVVSRIDALLNDDMTSDKTEQFERIAPVARRVSAPTEQQVETQKRTSAGWWVAGAVLVLLAVGSTLLFLPRFLAQSTADIATATDTVAEAQARLDNQAAVANQERAAVYEKWLLLEAMNVSSWAQLRAQRALELLQEGEQLISKLDHLAAIRLLEESDQLFGALLEQSAGIAADHRAAGWQAFNSGNGEKAGEHFRIVLAIEPNDDEVRDALLRTGSLDRVTALTRQARERESAGDLDGALAAMNDAYRIDPGNTDVERETHRLKSTLAARGFQATMSQVYAALASKNYPAARKALQRASGLRPAAPEVRDAQTQLELAERDVMITSLLARANEAETVQDWETAIGLYSELLEIDSALVLAQQGRDRARRLASLTTRTEALLAAPEFSKDDVRRRAETLLQQIDSVEAHAPELRSLAVRLGEALSLSRLPVKVRFESDNLTEIQVYRVGRLGLFDTREIELMPGQYTVVGTRAGYRDVRAKLIVEAGKEPTPMMIRCEEQI